jgi:hypothetical protein
MSRLTPLLALALLSVGCSSAGSGLAPSTSPVPATATLAPTGQCATGDPLTHVYDPARLHVLSRCQEVRGRVLAVIHEIDGDSHIWLSLDPGQEQLLAPANHYAGKPALVVEIIPECSGQPASALAAAQCPASPLKAPAEGQHIRVWGAYVADLNHNWWREIHPVEGWAPL